MTKAELDAILHYNSESGVFTWLVSKGQRKIGQPAGTLHPAGYIVIRVNYKTYRAHRLAWLTMTGAMPDEQIDHINTDRLDNRFSNLRLSNQMQNTYNQSIRTNNKSGVKGVHWHKSSNAWRAVIGVNGRKIQLGVFHSIDLAAKAIKVARALHHHEFARD